eukprot:10758958-Ditylum_brightwellii.AAC.1
MDQPVHGTSTRFNFDPVGQILAALWRYFEPQVNMLGAYDGIDGRIETCKRVNIWPKTDPEQTVQPEKSKGNIMVEIVANNDKVEYG